MRHIIRLSRGEKDYYVGSGKTYVSWNSNVNYARGFVDKSDARETLREVREINTGRIKIEK